LRELVEDLESRVTPMLVVGGKMLVGFDHAEYEAALRTLEK